MLCSYSSCHAMLVLHRILVHVMLFRCMLMVRTTCFCYAHEPNLNVDQVPPNRALFVQPQLPVRAGLDAVCRWASLTRIHQSGKATRGSYPDQVTAVVLIASLVMGTRPHLGQVLGHAMVGAMRWSCRDDTGLPRTWLV